MDSVKRSLVKAVTWRIVATFITALLVLIITGSVEFAASIGIVDTIIKFFAYFAHERAWEKVSR